MSGTRKDPYKSFRFLVEIDGIVQAGFNEVTVPESSQEPIEYREGTDSPTMRKIPGMVKYGNVILKWGTTDSMELYSWRKEIEDGQSASGRRNMAIIVLDEIGTATARWEFTKAWPTKYNPAELKASSSEIAIETLEIAHEGMKRVS